MKMNEKDCKHNASYIEYGFDVTSYKKREEEIAEQIEYIKNCNDEDILLDVVRDYDKDVSVRIAACDRITAEYRLNYLLAASTLSRNEDELMIALHIVPRIKDQELINDTMQDFLFTTFLVSSRGELIANAILCITKVSILEEFIRYAESTGRIGLSVIESAYNRLIVLNEEKQNTKSEGG